MKNWQSATGVERLPRVKSRLVRIWALLGAAALAWLSFLYIGPLFVTGWALVPFAGKVLISVGLAMSSAAGVVGFVAPSVRLRLVRRRQRRLEGRTTSQVLIGTVGRNLANTKNPNSILSEIARWYIRRFCIGPISAIGRKAFTTLRPLTRFVPLSEARKTGESAIDQRLAEEQYVRGEMESFFEDLQQPALELVLVGKGFSGASASKVYGPWMASMRGGAKVLCIVGDPPSKTHGPKPRVTKPTVESGIKREELPRDLPRELVFGQGREVEPFQTACRIPKGDVRAEILAMALPHWADGIILEIHNVNDYRTMNRKIVVMLDLVSVASSKSTGSDVEKLVRELGNGIYGTTEPIRIYDIQGLHRLSEQMRRGELPVLHASAKLKPLSAGGRPRRIAMFAAGDPELISSAERLVESVFEPKCFTRPAIKVELPVKWAQIVLWFSLYEDEAKELGISTTSGFERYAERAEELAKGFAEVQEPDTTLQSTTL